MTVTALIATLLLTTGGFAANPVSQEKAWRETPAQRNARMQWWREARFGMFVHFGLYAIPAGKWGSQTGHGEWIRETAKIPVGEYEKLKSQFNPDQFDADEWVRRAKGAGMKYIVVTTKHHDGFGLFDSKLTDWCVRTSPYGKDLMRQIAAACRKYDVKLGWYHSIMDWHHPDYLPRRSWEGAARPVTGAEMDRFVEYLKGQLKEILTNYGQVDLLWFDGEWESTWTEAYARTIYEWCRKLSPKTIINNRVSNSRAGDMESSGGLDQMGDYGTPEQFIPATGLKMDWETCMTMNDHWGFNATDQNWKSSTELIQNLVDIASKGGNYLLNVGPRADGSFPPESVARLQDMGRWMEKHGASIYGTSASPFEALPWGRSTVKKVGKKTTVFLHVFNWPSGGNLVVLGLGSDPISATSVENGAKLRVSRTDSDLVISIPEEAPDSICSTIALEFESDPIVYRTPKILAPTDLVVDSLDVSVDVGSPAPEIRYSIDGSDPSAQSSVVNGRIRIDGSCVLRVASFAKGKRVSAIASREFRKVTPHPATAGVFTPGLRVTEYPHRGDTVPDFEKLSPGRAFSMPSLDLGYAGTPAEYVARRYEGFIEVPVSGVYVFELTSDDGSKLWIDGQTVVDNDGLHGASAKAGSIALAKGHHPILVGWFNQTGGAALGLRWALAGSELQQASAASFAVRRGKD